jgi:hypothetical protein
MKTSKDKDYNFTQGIASKIFEVLKTRGYGVEQGLNDEELQAVEKAFNAPLPPDLKLLLRAGVVNEAPSVEKPKSISNFYFPKWRSPQEEAERCQDWIEKHVFGHDIRNAGYWSEQFGNKPNSIDDAIKQAVHVIRTWPPLFPVFGHRFICSAPNKEGNPVLSIWQATDSIPYGANLLDYMDREFTLELGIAKENPYGVAVLDPEPVPFWSEAFFGIE